jgi:hypothetical protein
MAAAWYIENGEIRDLLRHIFPNLQDCLKVLFFMQLNIYSPIVFKLCLF